MTYQIRPLGAGRYEVVNVRTGQVRYSGSIDGARAAQASLNR